jgi:molybdate transport system ATP-binding protein
VARDAPRGEVAHVIRLDLTLPLGEFPLEVKAELSSAAIAVMGPSGAGKTSLLEAIAGLRRARGRIEVDGQVLLDSDHGITLPPERRRVGYVPQDALLFPHLSVEENVAFGLGATAERIEEVLRWLELAPLRRRMPHALSGGERQRVAIARALAIGPALLLLDEPLAALDVALKDRLLPYLLEVRARANVPLIYVTHQLAEARHVASEALVLERGRPIAAGPVDEVLGAPRVRALDAHGGAETFFEGTVRPGDPPRLEVAPELAIAVAEPAEGRAIYSLRGDDVLIATHPLDGVSARNVFEGELRELSTEGSEVLLGVYVHGHRFAARVTTRAASDLSLATGRRVWIAFKAHAMKRIA